MENQEVPRSWQSKEILAQNRGIPAHPVIHFFIPLRDLDFKALKCGGEFLRKQLELPSQLRKHVQLALLDFSASSYSDNIGLSFLHNFSPLKLRRAEHAKTRIANPSTDTQLITAISRKSMNFNLMSQPQAQKNPPVSLN